jgi:hypothetical protein
LTEVPWLITKYYCDQIKKVEWVGHVAHMGEMRSAYKILEKKRGNETTWKMCIDGKIALNGS